jgi:cysteinyl-tRNA synthetase
MPMRQPVSPKVLISLFLAVFLFSFTTSSEKKTASAGLKMQRFVTNISKYAKSIDSSFIIIPQNGPELAFSKLNPEAGKDAAYLNAIDGIAVEDLFFDGKVKTDSYRLAMLRKIQIQKQVLLSDYITNNSSVSAITNKAKKENFLFFPRRKANEHYQYIPKKIQNENANNILKISDARNYLYLINPAQFETKAAYFKAIAATNYDLVAIDLFYDDIQLTTAETEGLKTKANGGKRLLISYVNIGAAENWRYYWKKDWGINNPRCIKKKYDGYDNEFYVEFWNRNWQKIIYGNDRSYVKKILDAGFDGIFLDNVEGYYFLYN